MDTMFKESLNLTIMYFSFMIIFPTAVLLINRSMKKTKEHNRVAFLERKNSLVKYATDRIGKPYKEVEIKLGKARNSWDEDGVTINRHMISEDIPVKNDESEAIYLIISVDEKGIVKEVNTKSIYNESNLFNNKEE